MDKIELFSYEACPFAQRTRIILNEKNISYKLTEIDLQNKPEWWKKISPLGKVPLLKINDKVIYESRIINEFIEEAFPNPPLMPKDLYLRSSARIWIDYCDSYLLPSIHSLVNNSNADKKNENKENLTEKLIFIEEQAFKYYESGPFFMGKEISLVDIQFIPFFERFPSYEYYWDIKIPKECKNLLNWLNIMNTKESYLSTANSDDYHIERYKKYIT